MPVRVDAGVGSVWETIPAIVGSHSYRRSMEARVLFR
jgi:hypothetical protein